MNVTLPQSPTNVASRLEWILRAYDYLDELIRDINLIIKYGTVITATEVLPAKGYQLIQLSKNDVVGLGRITKVPIPQHINCLKRIINNTTLTLSSQGQLLKSAIARVRHVYADGLPESLSSTVTTIEEHLKILSATLPPTLPPRLMTCNNLPIETTTLYHNVNQVLVLSEILQYEVGPEQAGNFPSSDEIVFAESHHNSIEPLEMAGEAPSSEEICLENSQQSIKKDSTQVDDHIEINPSYQVGFVDAEHHSIEPLEMAGEAPSSDEISLQNSQQSIKKDRTQVDLPAHKNQSDEISFVDQQHHSIKLLEMVGEAPSSDEMCLQNSQQNSNKDVFLVDLHVSKNASDVTKKKFIYQKPTSTDPTNYQFPKEMEKAMHPNMILHIVRTHNGRFNNHPLIMDVLGGFYQMQPKVNPPSYLCIACGAAPPTNPTVDLEKLHQENCLSHPAKVYDQVWITTDICFYKTTQFLTDFLGFEYALNSKNRHRMKFSELYDCVVNGVRGTAATSVCPVKVRLVKIGSNTFIEFRGVPNEDGIFEACKHNHAKTIDVSLDFLRHHHKPFNCITKFTLSKILETTLTVKLHGKVNKLTCDNSALVLTQPIKVSFFTGKFQNGVLDEIHLAYQSSRIRIDGLRGRYRCNHMTGILKCQGSLEYILSACETEVRWNRTQHSIQNCISQPDLIWCLLTIGNIKILEPKIKNQIWYTRQFASVTQILDMHGVLLKDTRDGKENVQRFHCWNKKTKSNPKGCLFAIRRYRIRGKIFYEALYTRDPKTGKFFQYQHVESCFNRGKGLGNSKFTVDTEIDLSLQSEFTLFHHPVQDDEEEQKDQIEHTEEEKSGDQNANEVGSTTRMTRSMSQQLISSKEKPDQAIVHENSDSQNLNSLMILCRGLKRKLKPTPLVKHPNDLQQVQTSLGEAMKTCTPEVIYSDSQDILASNLEANPPPIITLAKILEAMCKYFKVEAPFDDHWAPYIEGCMELKAEYKKFDHQTNFYKDRQICKVPEYAKLCGWDNDNKAFVYRTSPTSNCWFSKCISHGCPQVAQRSPRTWFCNRHSLNRLLNVIVVIDVASTPKNLTVIRSISQDTGSGSITKEACLRFLNSSVSWIKYSKEKRAKNEPIDPQVYYNRSFKIDNDSNTNVEGEATLSTIGCILFHRCSFDPAYNLINSRVRSSVIPRKTYLKHVARNGFEYLFLGKKHFISFKKRPGLSEEKLALQFDNIMKNAKIDIHHLHKTLRGDPSLCRLCWKKNNCIGVTNRWGHSYEIEGLKTKKTTHVYTGVVTNPLPKQIVSKEHYNVERDSSAFGRHSLENKLQIDFTKYTNMRILYAKEDLIEVQMSETICNMTKCFMMCQIDGIENTNDYLEVKHKHNLERLKDMQSFVAAKYDKFMYADMDGWKDLPELFILPDCIFDDPEPRSSE